MAPQAVYLERIGVNWAILYSSSILATLLWCTIFIVYRILRVGGISAEIRVYHRLVEMLVESAALYSAVIVILEVRSEQKLHRRVSDRDESKHIQPVLAFLPMS